MGADMRALKFPADFPVLKTESSKLFNSKEIIMLTGKVLIRVLSFVFIILVLTACGAKDDDIPDAVLQAQSLLAEQLEVPVEEVVVVSMEEVEWTDSCFGLGGPDEICAAVITPGWLIIFDVDGERYEVRAPRSR